MRNGSSQHMLFSEPEWQLAIFLHKQAPTHGIHVCGELVVDPNNGTFLAEVKDQGCPIKLQLVLEHSEPREGLQTTRRLNAVAIFYRHFAAVGTRVVQIGENAFAFPLKGDPRRLIFEYS